MDVLAMLKSNLRFIEWFYGSASAAPFEDPDGSDTGRFHGLDVTPHTPAARSPDSPRTGIPLPGGVARASEFFCQHILQHRLVQRQVRH